MKKGGRQCSEKRLAHLILRMMTPVLSCHQISLMMYGTDHLGACQGLSIGKISHLPCPRLLAPDTLRLSPLSHMSTKGYPYTAAAVLGQ